MREEQIAMVATMGTEYWYVQLPTGKLLRGERNVDAINRELSELVARGWEPTSIDSNAGGLGVMLKKVSDE